MEYKNRMMMMNKIIKNTSILSVILLLFSVADMYAQQSDFEIQQNFQSEFQDLQNHFESVSTSEELSELEQYIEDFENRYSEHSDLINNAIYPDTFTQKVESLREMHRSSLESASVIEELNTKIDGLESEIDGFRNQVTTLGQETRSLQEQLEQSESNEQSQATLLRQYRENLEERDIFVSDFLEQLMNRYQNIDLSSQREISEASERLDDNPLEVLKTLVLEYINLAEDATNLESPDFIAMRAQHSFFEDVWERIGNNLTNTFASGNASEARQEIDGMLTTWQQAVDNQLWEALGSSFSENGIELGAFSSPDEFNNAIYNYVDEAHKVSMESNSEEDFNHYSNFNSYWNNTVKPEWGSLLIEAEILTQAEISAIDMKVNEWGDAAATTSNLLFILLIVSVAVIIGLIVLLLTRKS